MTPSLIAVALFAGWAILMIAIAISYRVAAVLFKGKPADSWTRGRTTDDPGLIERAGHAHLNTLENLPIFAAIVLAGVASGQGALIDPIAPFVLYARMAQSTVHLIGVSHWLVLARAAFFGIQIALFVTMIVKIL